MGRPLFCLFALLAAVPVCAQPLDGAAERRHLFPVVADGGGYESRLHLFVTNAGGAGNLCALDVQGPGMDSGIFGPHVELDLGGRRATFSLAGENSNLVLSSGLERALSFGYATLDCNEPVVARMLLSWHNAGATVSMTTLESARPGFSFQVPVLPRLGMQGLVLINEVDRGVSCSIEIEDLRGASIGGASLVARGGAASLHDLGELVGLPPEFESGAARISCAEPVSAVALPVNGSVFTALPAVPLDDGSTTRRTHYLPLIADGGGFASQLLVTNLADAGNACVVEFRGPGLEADRFGTTRGVGVAGTVTILEFTHKGEQIAWRSTGAGDFTFGYAALDCAGAVSAGNLLTVGSADNPAAITLVPGVERATEIQVPVVPRASGQAIVINNDHDSGANCEIQLTNLSGERRGVYDFGIPGKFTAAYFLGDLFEVVEGIAVVDCDQSVSAIGLPLSGIAFAALPPTIPGGTVLPPPTVTVPDPDPDPDPGTTPEPSPESSENTSPYFGKVLPFTEVYRLGSPIAPLQLPLSTAGNAPLRYTLEPAVPGLRFDPDSRRLTGTPSVENTYEMAYRVQDADGEKDFYFFDVRVAGPDTAPSFAGVAPPDRSFTLGEEIAPLQLPQARQGNQPISYSFKPRVPGLRFDAAKRQLVGAPWLPGEYEIRYTATDYESESADLHFTISIEADIDPELLLDPQDCANGVFIDEPASFPELESDCRAIVGFANHFIRGGQVREDNVVWQWGRGAQQKLENWEGITVFNNRLTRIELHGRNLRGSLPAGLLELDALETLNLFENSLSGPIPTDIGRLASLRVLQLNHNQFSGEIPPELGELRELTYLSLNSNDLSGEIPNEMGQLSNLVILNLSANRLTGEIPRSLLNFEHLQSLALADNGLTGGIPPEIGQLSSLGRLSLEMNQLTGHIPVTMGQLRELTYLFLGYNRLTGPIPAEFGNLAKLSEFWAGTNQLSGPIPVELSRLQELRSLHLADNHLSGPLHEGFARLPKLEFLELTGNRLRGELSWEFRERIDRGELAFFIDSNLITGYPPLPPRERNPVYSASPSANGNASHHSIAYYQGPLVMEWDWEGARLAHQTPILGRWAALAVRVDHGVEDPPLVATSVLGPDGAELADSLEEAAYPATEATGPGQWRTEYLFHLPGRLFQAGNQIIHKIDPENELAETDESDNISKPVVLSGETPPKFTVTFIPVQFTNDDPWITEADLDSLMLGTLTLMPIADDYEARLGEPHWMGAGREERNAALYQILQRWNLEAEENEFYHGISDSLARGTAYIDGRAALSSASIFGTIPHEFGHNLSLAHTPGCGADGPDLEYPHPYGRLGPGRGWDPNWRRWETQEDRADGSYASDIMSYCGFGHFVSSYNYRKLVEYWLAQGVETGTSAVAVLPAEGPAGLADADMLRAAADGSLALSGVVHDNGAWSLDQAQWSERAPRRPADDGGYTLHLFDRAGVQLYAEPLSVIQIKEEGGAMWAARTPPPLRTATDVIIVDANGAEVLRQSLPELNGPASTAEVTSLAGSADASGSDATGGSTVSTAGGTATAAVTSTGAINLSGCANGDFIDNAGARPGLVADCEVLVNFADSRIRANQVPDDHPMRQWGAGSQQKLDDWAGITLADNRVQGIDLSKSRLRGGLPAEFVQLDGLEVLDLHRNNLSGPIPLVYGEFPRLKVLRLFENLLEGPLPLELTELSHLVVLSLDGNKLFGPIPPELGRLKRLERLSLMQNDFIGGIPPELAQLQNLKSLSLGHNELTGPIPPELGGLRKLEHLFLGGNRLSGRIPRELVRLHDLKYLFLHENELTGPIPSVFGEFSSIVWLDLGINRLTGTVPAELANLETLERLSVEYNQLTGPTPWQFWERAQRGGFIYSTNGTMVSGLGPPPLRPANPAYSPDPARNGNASHHAIAYFQGPMVMEWDWTGRRVEHQTPILGRWAALAVSVDHEVEAPPPVITRVLDGSDAVLSESLTLAVPPVTTGMGPGKWRSEYVFQLPGELYQAGNRIVHVIDPDNVLAETDENDNVGPPVVLGGEPVPKLRIKFIPIQIADKGGDVWWENTEPEVLMQGIRALMPISGEVEARIGLPMPTDAQNVGSAIQDLLELWNVQAEPDEFYHGITDLSSNGLGYTSGQVAVSPRSVFRVIPHEFGHNFSLAHTPGCGAATVDFNYPWQDGRLGQQRGWDPNLRQFVSREGERFVDVMSYCGQDRFISGYNYSLASNHWRNVELGSGSGRQVDMHSAGGENRASGPPVAGAEQGAILQAAAETRALALAGYVDDLGDWHLTQARHSPQAPRQPLANGDHTLILRDGAGVQLYAEPLTLMLPPEAPPGSRHAMWAARTPIPLRIARELIILNEHGHEVLRERLPEIR